METSAKFLVLRVLQQSQFYRMPVPTIEHSTFIIPHSPCATHGMPVPDHLDPVNERPSPSSQFIWFIWFIWFISFNQTNDTNQITSFWDDLLRLTITKVRW